MTAQGTGFDSTGYLLTAYLKLFCVNSLRERKQIVEKVSPEINCRKIIAAWWNNRFMNSFVISPFAVVSNRMISVFSRLEDGHQRRGPKFLNTKSEIFCIHSFWCRFVIVTGRAVVSRFCWIWFWQPPNFLSRTCHLKLFVVSGLRKKSNYRGKISLLAFLPGGKAD